VPRGRGQARAIRGVRRPAHRAVTPRRLRTLSNLKLELRPPDRAPLEIYAKVVHVSGDGQVALRFTPLRPDTQAWVEERLSRSRVGE
jgi:hypothetical protein